MNQIRLCQIFRSICDLRLQQHRIWSFPILHVYTAITKLERKPYFPFLKAVFPAGAEHSTFLQLTNIRKKNCLRSFFVAIRFQCHITFQCLSEEHGKLETNFFCVCVSNKAILTFLLFLISPSDYGT